jgi:hypothetical protein
MMIPSSPTSASLQHEKGFTCGSLAPMAGCGGLSRLIGWKGFGHRLTNVFGPMLICPWARSLMVNSRCGKSNQKKGKAASFLAMQGGCMMSTHGHEQWSFPFRTPAVRWRPSTCPSVGVRRRARRHYFSRWLPFGPARGHVNGHSGAPGVSGRGMWEGRGTACWLTRCRVDRASSMMRA